MPKADAFLPRLTSQPLHRVLLPAAMALAGTMILTLSAKVTVPMWPVPMTLQTMVLPMLAAVLGFRLGMATVLLYLAEAAMGLPVLQGTPERGIGLAYMVGPTGGYLLGFIAMAAIVGWAADRGWWKSPVRIGGAMLLAEVALLTLGAGWLMVLMGVEKGLQFGIGPFIVPDLVKLALAAGLVPLLGGLVRKLMR